MLNVYMTSYPENCDYDNFFLITEESNSRIIFELKIDGLVSIQSKSDKKQQLKQYIQTELLKFKWLIHGPINIDMNWYLSSINRQETDKGADLDNLIKPILDSFIGLDGILVDDSQVKSLCISWISKREDLKENLLRINLYFNNDNCLSKENLYFIHYRESMCFPYNIDLKEKKEIISLKIILKGFKIMRPFQKVLHPYLTLNEYDFHITRLSHFKDLILDKKAIDKNSLDIGLTFIDILRHIRFKKF